MIFLIIFSFQWVSWGEEKIDNSSNLYRLIPTEERLEEITDRPIWKYFHKETGFDHDSGILESGQFLLKDIGRVYEPIHYTFKVPVVLIEIQEFENEVFLLDYWEGSGNNNFENMYEKARFSGIINENSKCFFEHSDNGAITTCYYDKFLIQSTLSDSYQEHFDYDNKHFELNQNEITTQIMTEILNNIDNDTDQRLEVYKILQKIVYEKENTVKKTIDVEKENKYGVENYSCIKDEFGLITISGQYNNDELQKDKVILKITFFDRQKEPIGENIVNLTNVKEFEIKRFLGNTNWDDSFFSCSINIE
jgi:hypothetical protein